MKLNTHTPCAECPFREKSVAGWLGPWTLNSILAQVHGEGGLACHKSVESKLKKKKLSDTELFNKAHICVGSLQHANASHKLYRNKILRAMQDTVGKGIAILDLRAFRKHHGE